MSTRTGVWIRRGAITVALATVAIAFAVHAVTDDSPAVALDSRQNSTGTSTRPDAETEVSVDLDGFANWAMLDRSSGRVAGENLQATSTPQSMIKPWLVADYLHRSGSDRPKLLDEASDAIRISDDKAAQAIYQASGGDASISRLIDTCGLKETTVFPQWWSKTEMSVGDAARMGACIGDGRAAGSWTDWLLTEMRKVEGSTNNSDQHATSGGGRWGIIDGLPESLRSEVSIKNGWTQMADGDWDLNCLAVHDDWVLAIMLGYSGDRTLDYGAAGCQAIAAQVFS